MASDSLCEQRAKSGNRLEGLKGSRLRGSLLVSIAKDRHESKAVDGDTGKMKSPASLLLSSSPAGRGLRRASGRARH